MGLIDEVTQRFHVLLLQEKWLQNVLKLFGESSSNHQIPLPSSSAVALITSHTLQRGWHYFVTITYNLHK